MAMDAEQGMGAMSTQLAKVRYAYGPTGNLPVRPFSGNANIAAMNEKFALVPWRVARFGFRAIPTVVGGSDFLVLQQGEVSLFNVGSGGAYTTANGGMTGTAGDAESMAGVSGGIVRSGATFVAVGCEIARESCWFTPEADIADTLGVRTIPDWFSDNGPTGFTYAQELQKLVEPAATFRFQLFPNRQVVEERNGSLADWMARGSRLGAPGTFVAFTSEYGSGGEKTSAQVQAFITLGGAGGAGGSPARALRVQERLGLALPADGAVILEYSMKLWGYTVCGDPPTNDVCALPGAQNQSLGSAAALLRELREMFKEGAITRDQLQAQTAKLLDG